MHDPQECVTSSGMIRTGVGRQRVAEVFEPALAVAVDAVHDVDPGASVYVSGSVATGMVRPAKSDVDLLTVGIAGADAARIGRVLSGRFSGVCRAVEVAASDPRDFSGATDQAYGGRVFLRHYCVHLAGPDLRPALPDYPADMRAARGFNGDIAQHADRWRRQLRSGSESKQVGRRMARKSLLAVAGLVSVSDRTWTTDRTTAARRWAEIEPSASEDLHILLSWAHDHAPSERPSVVAALDGVVAYIASSFEASIGLWHGQQPSVRGRA